MVTVNMDEEKDRESFLTRIILGGRITVPQPVREKLGLKTKTLVKVWIRREEKA